MISEAFSIGYIYFCKLNKQGTGVYFSQMHPLLLSVWSHIFIFAWIGACIAL